MILPEKDLLVHSYCGRESGTVLTRSGRSGFCSRRQISLMELLI